MTANPKELEARARELLASELRKDGLTILAKFVKSGGTSDTQPDALAISVRAITRALSQPADESPADQCVGKLLHTIMAQREEVLAAFIAKYGFQPDEFVQCSQGGRWWVERKRQPAEPSDAAVERVARVLCAHHDACDGIAALEAQCWELADEQSRAEYMSQARAAIAAMRGEGNG